MGTRTVNETGAPGTFLSFNQLSGITAVGFLVDGDRDRNVSGYEVFGTVVPEPSSLLMLSFFAVIGVGAVYRRRSKVTV